MAQTAALRLKQLERESLTDGSGEGFAPEIAARALGGGRVISLCGR